METQAPDRRVGARILAGICSLPFLFYGLAYLVGMWTHSTGLNSLILLGLPLAALTFAALGLWYAISGWNEGARKRITRGTLFAIGLGMVGFVAGFFGPLILTPNSNQGPLLGFVVTGPWGTILGGLIGVFLKRNHS